MLYQSKLLLSTASVGSLKLTDTEECYYFVRKVAGGHYLNSSIVPTLRAFAFAFRNKAGFSLSPKILHHGNESKKG